MNCAFCGIKIEAGWGGLNLCRPCFIGKKNLELRKRERGENDNESYIDMSEMQDGESC